MKERVVAADEVRETSSSPIAVKAMGLVMAAGCALMAIRSLRKKKEES